MYALVLAAAMTAGTGAPNLHFRGGCNGCYGCSGYNAFSSCYGCYGSSCYGCYGSMSYGCNGCRGSYFPSFSFGSCYGCYGSSFGGGGSVAYAAYGCFGGCGGCYGGCFGGCTGYHGWAMPSYFVPPQMPGVKEVEKGKGGKDDKGGKGGMGGEGDSVSAPATVVIKAPLGVSVKVNGVETTRNKAEQAFQTPALPAGRSYAYTFVATSDKDGKIVRASRSITVQANSRSVVDFSDLGRSERATAKVTVLLPRDAKLFVNDAAYGPGARQEFDTPALEVGKTYFYTVKAQTMVDGRPVTDARKVRVEAGKAVTVDFTRAEKGLLTASR